MQRLNPSEPVVVEALRGATRPCLPEVHIAAASGAAKGSLWPTFGAVAELPEVRLDVECAAVDDVLNCRHAAPKVPKSSEIDGSQQVPL